MAIEEHVLFDVINDRDEADDHCVYVVLSVVGLEWVSKKGELLWRDRLLLRGGRRGGGLECLCRGCRRSRVGDSGWSWWFGGREDIHLPTKHVPTIILQSTSQHTYLPTKNTSLALLET